MRAALEGARDAERRGSLLSSPAAGDLGQGDSNYDHGAGVQRSGKTGTGGWQGQDRSKPSLWKSKLRCSRRRLGATQKQWEARKRKRQGQQERCRQRQGKTDRPEGRWQKRGKLKKEDLEEGRGLKRREAGGLLAPAHLVEDEATGESELGPLDERIGLSKIPHLEPAEGFHPAVTAAAVQNLEGPGNSGLQKFHLSASSSCTKLTLAGLVFSDLGGHIRQLLQPLVWERSSKTMTMAKDPIYPLPLGSYPDVPPEFSPWIEAMLLALNSLHGTGQTHTHEPTETQKRVVSGLLKFLKRFCSWVEPVPHTTFAELFEVKGVDYRGEEVKLARSFNSACISPTFPKEVGTLRLEEFCEGGCRRFVEEFELFLQPGELQSVGRTPRIMVRDEDWKEVCEGLVRMGICDIKPLKHLHHVGNKPLLNGMFAVSKNEFQGSLELHRLIMNLVPLNSICKAFKGDVCTLPTVAGFSAFYLEDNEVAVLCSEDIKCFYYLFQVPEGWRKYMGFAKAIPESMVPLKWKGESCHLVSRVLPMGWLNSVGLAQHVHRNVVRWSMATHGSLGTGERELRRDKPATVSPTMFRVYLDNWDEVRKLDTNLANEVEGEPSPAQLAVRQQYSVLNLPRHPKKAVVSQKVGEIQGALLDGEAGVAYAKPGKVMKYMGLAWELVQRGVASQRELQVVAGGLVYITMFRRALLCSLNAIWTQIEALKWEPPVIKRAIPREVKTELVRFLALVPLSQMDFRLPMRSNVTASDASSSGGGICATTGLTTYGVMAQQATTRGELQEGFDAIQVLTIGLFDGIAALRVATDCLRLPVAGHVSVECNEAANRVVESAFPGVITVKSVQEVTQDLVASWALEFPSVGVVLLGAGPPCQDVSKLNADRRGSQRGTRSSLYKEIPRIRALVAQNFPWAQTHLFVESVASMDDCDRAAMSEDLGLLPCKVDSGGISLARRPRLYWFTWDIAPEAGCTVETPVHEGWDRIIPISLEATLDQKDFLEAGWFLPPGQRLATFTTSRPSATPGRKPAGLASCNADTLSRWHEDSHRFPPYQYKPEYSLHHRDGRVRVATTREREAILGFPVDYTQFCFKKADRVGAKYDDQRKTLLGNSWSVPVVSCLLKHLFTPLGLMEVTSVQQVITRLTPGKGDHLQSVLLRPPLRRDQPMIKPDDGLAFKLSGLVSIKGEDLLLQAPTDFVVKNQRFRNTVPSKLWKWREIAGWAWSGPPEHINQLEMRATLTTIKWLIQKCKAFNCRSLHLTDSLVVLHSLTRGRSSSRRLRRVIMRINSLLLAANLHPVWAYVHTSMNPADRPSRKVKKTKWGKGVKS